MDERRPSPFREPVEAAPDEVMKVIRDRERLARRELRVAAQLARDLEREKRVAT